MVAAKRRPQCGWIAGDSQFNTSIRKGWVTMSRRISVVVLIALIAVSLVVGCSKINKENYDKIQVGMTYDEVEALLGTPDEAKDVIGTKSCIWGKAPQTISIKFVGDKVVFHSAEGLK
jgi:hypothetical protein